MILMRSVKAMAYCATSTVFYSSSPSFALHQEISSEFGLKQQNCYLNC